MMNDKTGKEFESLVAKIYSIISASDSNTKVTLDENIESPDGPRQFDVVIRSTVANIEILTVVEVRDWNKNLSVTHIDGLHSKMRDVNANKAILVARKGFSSGAKKKAARLGIDLCTAHDLRNIESFTTKAPVVVHAMDFDLISIDFSMNAPGPFTVDHMQFFINGNPVLDIFRSKLASREFVPVVCEDSTVLSRLNAEAEKMRVGGKRINHSAFGDYLNVWMPPPEAKITYIDPVTGRNIEVGAFRVSFVLRYDYYFGYLNDLPGSFALDSISAARADLFFLEEEILSFSKHFSKFTDLVDVPVQYAANIFTLARPNFEALPVKKLN